MVNKISDDGKFVKTSLIGQDERKEKMINEKAEVLEIYNEIKSCLARRFVSNNSETLIDSATASLFSMAIGLQVSKYMDMNLDDQQVREKAKMAIERMVKVLDVAIEQHIISINESIQEMKKVLGSNFELEQLSPPSAKDLN